MNWYNVLLYLFVAVSTIQLTFYLSFLKKFVWIKTTKPKQKKIGVSVIICAKNEAENLKRFLPSIIAQNYPEYEIVLIDDDSQDETLEVMESYAEKHNYIKLVRVKNIETFWANKKYALTLGIKAAKHDYLLFTDADCYPVSKNWIKSMSSHFSNNKTIVLGYGAYEKVKNSFLNKIIRFETLLTAVNYFSYAKLGIPYMAVGRNLGYRKDVFFNTNGFINHMQIQSGDDDLFINQVATKENTTISLNKESFTISVPKHNLSGWIKQKRRHITTSKLYKRKHKIALSLQYLSNLLFWILSIALLMLNECVQWVAIIILIKLITQGILLRESTKKLNEKDLLWIFPLLEICLLSLQLYIFINNLFSTPKHWK